MDDLYDSAVESLSNSDKKEFEKVSNAFQDVAKWLHSKKAFTPEMLDEPEPTALISATHNVLSEELRRIERNIPDKMAQALDENIFLFSGFKTYHELNDASRLLKDEDGGFKPFEKFLQDVRLIDAKYNQNYLYAEYNFATASTQMAAKWSDIERDGDDYDLQYRTAMDGLVREEHAALEGITLPPSDKFWNKYYPPNGWNCRCTTVQVLKDKYPRSNSNQACEAGERATTHIGKNGENKSAIFRFNPGKEGKVFPPKHPYLPKGCGDCEFNRLAYNPNSEKCRACKIIQKCYDRASLLVKETVKIFDNGGKLETYAIIDKTTDDYKRIEEAALYFASQGKNVTITPKFDGAKFCPDYDKIYGSLKGTKYYGCCPDMLVDGKFYEHEGFTTKNAKNAFRNMCNHGLRQSDRIVIENCGLTDGSMLRSIHSKIHSGMTITEVWIHEHNGYRRLY